MNKLKYIIAWFFSILLLINCSFWLQSVLIIDQNNNVIQQYNIEDWQTQEITLVWNWSKNWNAFTFEDWFDWTDVFYTDIYWKDQKINTFDDLYINWSFDIWYTWQQYLNLIENSCYSSSWFMPIFTVTWTISNNTWNIFTNFTDNMFTLLLSNIPWYIQYITIFAVILLLVSLIRRLWRRK